MFQIRQHYDATTTTTLVSRPSVVRLVACSQIFGRLRHLDKRITCLPEAPELQAAAAVVAAMAVAALPKDETNSRQRPLRRLHTAPAEATPAASSILLIVVT